MADKKITGLTELTAAASDDYLEIVDTSTNTNKKISRETLLSGVTTPFFLPPASFGNVTWTTLIGSYVQNFVDGSETAIHGFIYMPETNKKLELTEVMTSDVVGNLDMWVELRYLQEAGGQPGTATVSGNMVHVINPAFAMRKKTVTLDLSGYPANSTFQTRIIRKGNSAADTCSGIGYFFGVSGRWID